ncbi:hypothetical protein C7H79_15120 [Nitrosomonas supralitoralis]|uniref:Uncharacterized protein n=1 Tax=Nitrosomonas supralitoralis TaxID=2116706 RepID=A0A2P7NRM9_9PROT|nr:hypothetical protein C7H79_15120 [Nitrosomonas supralitoralis]
MKDSATLFKCHRFRSVMIQYAIWPVYFLTIANQKGLVNLDSLLSGNLAQPKPCNRRQKRSESMRRNRAARFKVKMAIAAIKGDKALAELVEQLMCIRTRFRNGNSIAGICNRSVRE